MDEEGDTEQGLESGEELQNNTGGTCQTAYFQLFLAPWPQPYTPGQLITGQVCRF